MRLKARILKFQVEVTNLEVKKRCPPQAGGTDGAADGMTEAMIQKSSPDIRKTLLECFV